MTVARAARSVAIAIALVIAIAAAAGCGSPTPTPLPSSTGSADATPPPVPSHPPSASPATPASGLAIAVDPALYDLLPAAIAGIELRADDETAGELAADPALAGDVAGIAVAVAFGPVASGDEVDYAIAALARLRPGVFDDAWFRDWRDTYDAQVCEQAGGVELGRSEITIGDRTVHRSTCVGGIVIHHAYLEDPGVVVSIQGAGAGDLGRQIMAGLEE